MNPIDRQILQIALPSIVSNITVPLLGLIDVAIVGHLGSPAYIGAIAVGGMLFNIIYWIFGFLRMGTSGMTSQAYGKRDLPEIVRLLIRSVGIGLAVALCLILLQVPIRQAAFQIIHPTEEVREMATLYFHICIWGAPAMLGLYGLSGWYIGMQNSRIPMYIAITQNIVNIMASLSLVCFFGMKVEGVALGTLIAQYAGFLMGLVLWMNRYGKLKKYIVWKGVLQKEAMIRFFQVNRDIFLRTLCLVAVTLFFIWGAGLTVLFTLVYASGGNAFLALLTDDRNVITAADTYFYWALAIPAAGIAAFIWDGIFIGATATRGMLLSMAASAVSFFAVYYGFHTVLGNHALWLAFLVYLSMRGAMQTLLSRKVMEKSFH